MNCSAKKSRIRQPLVSTHDQKYAANGLFMIFPQTMFYQRPDLSDRVSVWTSQHRMPKDIMRRYLTIIFRAKTQRRKGYFPSFACRSIFRESILLSFFAQRRNDAKDMQSTSHLFLSRKAAACIHLLTLLLSHSLTPLSFLLP